MESDKAWDDAFADSRSEYISEVPYDWRDDVTAEQRKEIHEHLHAIAKIAGVGLDERDYIGWFRYIPASYEGGENLEIRWERYAGAFAWENGKITLNEMFSDGRRLEDVPPFEDRDLEWQR